MLKQAHDIIGKCGILIHNDREFHYRLDYWINLMKEYNYKSFVSKK